MSVTKQEIQTNIERLKELIAQENERADKIFRTKVLNQKLNEDGTYTNDFSKTGKGAWDVYRDAGFSNEKEGDVGPFIKARQYAKEIKEWQAKDPELAKAEKKRKLQEQLAALEAEEAEVAE